MPSNIETLYQQKLRQYQAQVAEHANCVAKTYNQFGLFIKCLDCEIADLDEEPKIERLDNAEQHYICKMCGSSETTPIRNDICGACRDEIHVNDFEFGEATEHWTSFTLGD